MAAPQKLVNFDEDHTNYQPPKYDPYGSTAGRDDGASVTSHATSGILAHDYTNSLNERGETDAQTIAQSFRSAPSTYSQNTTTRSINDTGLDRRTSAASQLARTGFAPSGKDSLGDIDEEFDPYPSSGRAKGFQTDDDDSLVQNAADMGRMDKPRAMGDLGMWNSVFSEY